MNKQMLEVLLGVSEHLAQSCIHEKVVITADGVYLEQTKEFHPISETLLD